MGERITVGITVRAPMDLLWHRTQCPAQHARWDLRFGEIRPLVTSAGEGQRFRYATRLLPGLTVAGVGVHRGERHRADGSCTSALAFSSTHPLSIIRAGTGYWRYQPEPAGTGSIVFRTGYDYRPGWGRMGRWADRLLFRRLIGWATAWSFDRLRLWCELEVSPERSRNQALAELTARMVTTAAALRVLVRASSASSPARAGAAVLAGGAMLVAAFTLPPRSTTPAARRTRRLPPVPAAHGGRSLSPGGPA